MTVDGTKILKIPLPKTKHSSIYRRSSAAWSRLEVLSRLKPEVECASIQCDSSKAEIIKLHSMARRYGFKVTCRPAGSDRVLVWVRKPGVPKDLFRLWKGV